MVLRPSALGSLALLAPIGALLLAACASSAPAPAVAGAETLPALPALRFLPLADGRIWAYDAEDEVTGAKGLFVTRARRLLGTRFSLTTGERTRVLEARADGIAFAEGDAYLLKMPLTPGAEWRGERGTTVRVNAVDQVVEVPAGKFAGCVETVEQAPSAGESSPARRVTTVFCPDVGIASLRVEAWDQGKHAGERAVLKSFGEPVTLVK